MSEARPDAFLRLERVRGIEPPSKAWEAFVLPLNYTRRSDVSIGTMEWFHGYTVSVRRRQGLGRSMTAFLAHIESQR